MSRKRVEIDLNSVRADGTTRVRLANASETLHVGDIVTAFESEDRVAAYAYVDRVDTATGYAFITVNRDSLRDDDGTLDGQIQYQGMNRAYAKSANQRAERASRGTAAVTQTSKTRYLSA